MTHEDCTLKQSKKAMCIQIHETTKVLLLAECAYPGLLQLTKLYGTVTFYSQYKDYIVLEEQELAENSHSIWPADLS